MALQQQLIRRVLLLGGTCMVFLFALFTVMTWPSMFFSLSRELTGTELELQETAHFTPGVREGFGATVYQISGEAADALSKHPESLAAYPMWSAAVFDGYQRVHWQSIAELESGPDRVLAKTVCRNEAAEIDATRIQSLEEVRQLAAALAKQEGVLVGGWYRARDGVVTNYFVYVLDLKRRLLVKVTLLT